MVTDTGTYRKSRTNRISISNKRVIEEKGNVNTIQLEPINNANRHAISTKIPKRIAVMYYFPLKSRICGKIIKVQQKQIMFNAKEKKVWYKNTYY